jgi:hypothetical protein
LYFSCRDLRSIAHLKVDVVVEQLEKFLQEHYIDQLVMEPVLQDPYVVVNEMCGKEDIVYQVLYLGLMLLKVQHVKVGIQL